MILGSLDNTFINAIPEKLLQMAHDADQQISSFLREKKHLNELEDEKAVDNKSEMNKISKDTYARVDIKLLPSLNMSEVRQVLIEIFREYPARLDDFITKIEQVEYFISRNLCNKNVLISSFLKAQDIIAFLSEHKKPNSSNEECKNSALIYFFYFH